MPSNGRWDLTRHLKGQLRFTKSTYFALSLLRSDSVTTCDSFIITADITLGTTG